MSVGQAARSAPRAGSGVVLLCGFAIACAALARASSGYADSSSPYLQRENPLRSLLPSPEVRAEREQAALEQKLERLLAGQPGVAHAEVVLSLPRLAQVPLDQELPPARATVAVRMQDEKVELGAVSELARSALPEGTELRVIRRAGTGTGARSDQEARRVAPRAAPGVRRVGPFRVEEPSAGALRATLAGLLASNAVLAGLLLWRRARR